MSTNHLVERLRLVREAMREFDYIQSTREGESERVAMIRKIINYSDTLPPLPSPEALEPGALWRNEGGELDAIQKNHASVTSNPDFREAMQLVGGGAWDLVREAEQYCRVHGGYGNIYRSLLAYVIRIDVDMAEVVFKPPVDIAVQLLGFNRMNLLQIARPESYLDKYRIPADTSGSAIAYAAYSQFIPKTIGVMHGLIHEFLLILENTFRRALDSDEIPLLPLKVCDKGQALTH